MLSGTLCCYHVLMLLCCILEKPGVPSSKPATVPSTGATSRIVHPDEDISLVSVALIKIPCSHSALERKFNIFLRKIFLHLLGRTFGLPPQVQSQNSRHTHPCQSHHHLNSNWSSRCPPWPTTTPASHDGRHATWGAWNASHLQPNASCWTPGCS